MNPSDDGFLGVCIWLAFLRGASRILGTRRRAITVAVRMEVHR
jgi:hypothetical protein